MRDANAREGASLSVLTIEVRVPDGGSPDWPEVDLLVDGVDPFAGELPTWRGLHARDVLREPSPLLPVDGGRRVAVRVCSCGIAGCGVVAPVVWPSPDGGRVSWVDPRDDTGVFDGPVEPTSDLVAGRGWDFADLHFDRAQYVAEVERASADRTWRAWTTLRRDTARLLVECLMPLGLVVPPDLDLVHVTIDRTSTGVALLFERITTAPERRVRQRLLRLTSTETDPAAAAADMADQLLAVPPERWVERFGWPAR